MSEEISLEDVVKHLQEENERLRFKLAYLYMRQKTIVFQLVELWKHWVHQIKTASIDDLQRLAMFAVIVEAIVLSIAKLIQAGAKRA